MEKVIYLKNYYPAIKSNAKLTYFSSGSIKPCKCMVVFPGGGYAFCSDREADPIAMFYASQGFNCFVVDYSVWPFEFPTPLDEALASVAFIRKHAKEYNIIEDKIAIVGFSAGGHLAGSLGAHYNDENLLKRIGLNKDEAKPNAVVLSYAVLLTGEGTHTITSQSITQKKEELMKYFDIPSNVTKDYPPTYIWNTATDQAVPGINSIKMMEALYNAGVIAELHVFPTGPHGLSLSKLHMWEWELTDEIEKDHKYCEEWTVESVKFLERYM